MGRLLSKSKLIAFRQCPKRVWLEVHRPELREDSANAQARFADGNHVGDIARGIYDPKGKGVLIDPQIDGFEAAFEKTKRLVDSPQPIFEAGFRAAEALAFADAMLPVQRGGKLAWKMVEVKSSTSVKDYQRDDVAIQLFLARSMGVPLASASVACIDSDWVYPGGGDYAGLLFETDVTKEAIEREPEIRDWIKDAHRVVAKKQEPKRPIGKHCCDPFDCGFRDYCQSLVPEAKHPIGQLPGKLGDKLQAHIEKNQLTELKEVPDALLNTKQQRVKTAALSGKTFFNKTAAAKALETIRLPAYFMDFETTQSAVPRWKGTRPYQQIPFQFSVHRLGRTGKLQHMSFLDLSGNDPSLTFANALLAACGNQGAIFVYNASFEKARIRELAERYPRLAAGLKAVNDRVIDLLPIAREHYYHPSQEGSWSIKAVLPALCPDLDYAVLEGVKDGGMAMEAYAEAIAPETTSARKAEIEKQLTAYCALDTYALVRLWSIFSGSTLKVV
jgi:hypothetical protein